MPIQRELGPTETFFAFAHEHTAMLVVNAITFTGNMESNRLRVAIAKVKVAHPILCMRTIQKDGLWFFHHSAHDEIELKMTHLITGSWHDIAQYEIHTPFDITSHRPLIRFHLIQISDSQQVLLLVGSHVILDGISSTSIMEQILQVYANLDMPLKTHKFQPAMDILCQHLMVNPEHISQDTLATDEEIAHVIDRGSSNIAERKNRLLTLTLDETSSTKLINFCRQQGVTMNALLYAVAQKAIYITNGSISSQSITSGGNTNFRNACKPSLNKQDLGCYISMFAFRADVTADSTFWNLVQQNHQSLTKILNSTALVHSTRQEFWNNILSPDAIYERGQCRQGRFNVLHLSNMGRLSLEEHYADIKICSYHFFAGQHVLGASYWVGALTINKKLCISLITIDPIISDEKTQVFKEHILTELHTIAKTH